ncbi:hypothetical protein F5B22DRAFT_654608 [Xylaria bambusicola]|uniref:uncharacterized protein n=1 Tax=Xylaria bambusicola TaxID=326684 RepID=UPI002008CD91|nr:uncharacterized protein F5B22DRAFT_654608 [Xylaria bambusicola]KAI0517857.1 hypothetical protein F5B22DRAFT_654608 [Xylaria bambusicola]
MDDNWHASALNVRDRTRKIMAIHLIARDVWSALHESFNVPNVNVWYLYLELDNNTWIRLDVVPGSGDDKLRCKIRLISTDRSYPPNVVYKRVFTINGTMTLDDLVAKAQSNGRQKYTVTNEGRGRRHWYTTFIHDFEKDNTISATKFDMSWFFPSKDQREESPIGEGTFLT